MNNNPTTPSLIQTSLSDLINLAPVASKLRLSKHKINAITSGGHRSHFKGRGMEFDEVRLYQAGDDIRCIDWRVTARTNKTYTKLFKEEKERPVFISVDNRLAMHFATRGVFKSVQASKIASIIAWLAQSSDDKIGGQIFNELTCEEIKPQSGRSAVLRLLNKLTKTTNHKQENKQNYLSFNHILSRLQYHIHTGSQVYLISDFRGMDSRSEQYFNKLTHHCSVTLIYIYDYLETTLPKKGIYQLTNSKKNLTIDVSHNKAYFNYQQQYQQKIDYLEALSQKFHFSLIYCSTEDDVTAVLRKWI